ncbi:hypothetical protein O181_096604 [Austropuccinia psidii MF-1]|uniref:Uncharacterized protein n=1 Tax=Austropuccinia psidii MF-1 TaxID=1389203 RepID=A0A9Q3J7B9_9BASI|nr:hypothetical protein [Austropuccinia psidii MF-1]
MKLNHIISDVTRQAELWEEMIIAEGMYKFELINLIQGFQHKFRNSTRYTKGKINEIEKLLHTLTGIPTPPKQSESIRNLNPQGLDAEYSQMRNEVSTSFHTFEPSMGQPLLKEVMRLKEWPHFSGEGEYDHMEFIRGINMFKQDF